MIQIQLTQDEARLLQTILESHLKQLRMEMPQSLLDEWVETWRQEEETVVKIVRQLGEVAQSYPQPAMGEYA